jgi:hypothetical protein
MRRKAAGHPQKEDIMSLRNWVSRIAARQPSKRGGDCRARLCVEVLEDRLVLNHGVSPGGILQNLNLNDPPVGSTFDISQRPGNEWDPAIAIDPTHPSHLFSVANWDNQADYQGWGTVGLFAAHSSDGGAHWTSRPLADGSDGLPIGSDGVFVGGPPSVSWDQYGNLFLAYNSHVGSSTYVILALSTDGGQTFTEVGSFGNLAGAEPKVATGGGTVWVAFRNWDPVPAPVFVSLEATGAVVTGLGQVGAFSKPESAGGGRLGFLDDLAVGPQGRPILTYHDDYLDVQHSVNIYTVVDPDGLGPGGFNTAVLVTSSNVDLEHPILQSSQHAIAGLAPGLAWDLSSGPHHGRLYLVYTDASTPDDPATNIYVRYSDDSGTTWSTPTQVNDDNSGNSHFLPRIAVDQSTGWVAVSWYDARLDDGQHGSGDTDGVANDETELFATASVDPKGLSFLPDVEVASGPSRPVNTVSQWYSSFGDSSGLAFYNGTFYPAWADNSPYQSGNPDPANFDIVTAAVSVPWVVVPPWGDINGGGDGNHPFPPWPWWVPHHWLVTWGGDGLDGNQTPDAQQGSAPAAGERARGAGSLANGTQAVDLLFGSVNQDLAAGQPGLGEAPSRSGATSTGLSGHHPGALDTSLEGTIALEFSSPGARWAL